MDYNLLFSVNVWMNEMSYQYGTLYNNLTIWYMYYAFTQNIAHCYTYKKSSVFSLYSSVRNLIHLYY